MAAAPVAQPEVIEDEDHELMYERVGAVDVGKYMAKVCVRLPHPTRPGRRMSKVWTLKVTFNTVVELAQQMVAQRVEKVSLESTSDYWRIFYYLFEAHGLDVQLVDARQAKNLPGRPKTDKLDAVWLARLTEKGMLSPSFVPPAAVRVLRDYTRLRVDLTQERTRHWQRLEKLLEDALIKLSTVASKLGTVSARDMVEALIKGERNPRTLAQLARGRMKGKYADLVEALTGKFDAHHGELARILLDQIDALTRQIETIGTRVEQLIAELPAAQAPEGADPQGRPALDAVARLAEIPGISTLGAQIILAEASTDMTRFPTPERFASWAKLAPRTIQSGASKKNGRTGKGNPYLKGILGIAAAAAARTDTFLGDRYRRLVKRRGKLKALVAVARSILVAVWHLLANPHARFHDLGPDYHTTRQDIEKRVRNHRRQIELLGFHVTVTPITPTAPAA